MESLDKRNEAGDMNLEPKLGTSPGLPMRPCPHCNYPAVYDVCGQTDHVCFSGPRAERMAALFKRMGLRMTAQSPRVVSISNPAQSDYFYNRWVDRK